MMGAMDHNDVRELLEDAAIDPDGLERLMAGDTPNAALVAGHLAGCPECAEELARLHRAVGLIRPVVRSLPPPELRTRTLARIAAVGRPRPLSADREGDDRTDAARPTPNVVPLHRAPRPNRLGIVAGLAAALIVAVGATGVVLNASRDSTARAQATAIEALGDVARWTLRVGAAPDVQRIALASTSGASTSGSLVFSPSSTELVVVADELPLPPANGEYRCWVEVGGTRTSIGKMYFGGSLAYWVGQVPQLAGLDASARFGVSLVDLAASGTPGEPVLVSRD
ncbi:MAG: hypothetical protein QOF49_1701 [Chloroflexota bacterium]|jgi:hypothetical protein|nr:hypothetical protein [Chloroflexota bacterium]